MKNQANTDGIIRAKRAMRTPKRSPWGPIQDSKELAEGVLSVGTASHGGIKLSRARNAKVPESCRKAGGWYEEDCEWAIAALVHPDAFPGEEEGARDKCKNYYPDAYTEITGEKVSEAESYTLRQRAFTKATYFKFVARSAFGDWKEGVPKGFVGVYARRESDGAERAVLVPKATYRGGREFGYVLDGSEKVWETPA